MLQSYVLLQAETPQQPGGGMFINMLFFVGILAIFYFFMIRPQQKRQKDEKKFRENLNKGDKVVSIGGIHGKVDRIDEDSILVQVDENVKMRFDKSALRPPSSPPAK